MTSISQICFISACSNALFPHAKNQLNTNKTVNKRRPAIRLRSVAVASLARFRFRPSVHFRRLRTPCLHGAFLRKKSSRPFRTSFCTPKQFERLQKGEKELAQMEQSMRLQRSLEEAMFLVSPAPVTNLPLAAGENVSENLACPSADDGAETPNLRHGASTAPRIINRLMLTLPIVPSNSIPSRPTSGSASAASFLPPSPADTINLMSPTEPNDLITDIAAQERRVLELREELTRAASELGRLKGRLTLHEVQKKRTEMRKPETVVPVATDTAALEEHWQRLSAREVDRRKALMLSQPGFLNTPEKNHRRIFSGSHTRALSLLSPAKSGSLSVHEEEDGAGTRQQSPRMDRFGKRASWAPRSTHPASAMKQTAEDLKAGLWTFVEDLRQATVGDEPIIGQGNQLQPTKSIHRLTGDDKSRQSVRGERAHRAPTSRARPRSRSAFEDTPRLDETTPSRSNRCKTEEPKGTKRFSCTPLAVDSYKDDDWSNWDSPKFQSLSQRWSGSTVQGDMIPASAEESHENDDPL